MEEKTKEYPKKFYVQHYCPVNDDDDSINAEIEAQELNLNHPMLEITRDKNGYKVRLVKLAAKTVITAKEVK